jgi:hypothetical protein
MAVTQVATATGSALTPGTEAQLLTFTAPAAGGVYEGHVDVGNLVGIESVTLYVRSRYASGGTVRVVDVQSVNAQDASKLIRLAPWPAQEGVEYEIRALQVGGTGRAFPASIVRIGA